MPMQVLDFYYSAILHASFMSLVSVFFFM